MRKKGDSDGKTTGMTPEQATEYLCGVARRMGAQHRAEGIESLRENMHPKYRDAYDAGFNGDED